MDNFIDEVRPHITAYPELLECLKNHNAFFNDEHTDKVYIDWILDILRRNGYSIEVTEMSTADLSKDINKGSNWKRLYKFRWTIVYWDEDGYMVSARYSDNEKRNELTSINEANEDAIRYIVEHYKEIEKL